MRVKNVCCVVYRRCYCYFYKRLNEMEINEGEIWEI